MTDIGAIDRDQELAPVAMNWKAPDYAAVFRARTENLERIRSAPPSHLAGLKAHYRENPADFINDWGCAHEPRNVEIGLPALIPLVLFPRQRELIAYIMRKWRARESGLIEKSRDIGATWIAISLSCALCIFHDGVSIGFGSRKREYVDLTGSMKPILPKGRWFMEHLPVEFRGVWVAWRDAPHMRISFPGTGSVISGEGGDDLGRGDRTALYFCDEFAHHPKQDAVEAALSQTTNCRIYMSSVKGMSNLFARKRWSGKVEVFIFDYREDPRKDDAWYKKQQNELDPVVVAQEIDRDYSASVKGIVIPGHWVRAAIGARQKLGIASAGRKRIAFDVADEGEDKDAVAVCEGIEIVETDEWSGKGGDVFFSTETVFEICDDHGMPAFRYDADGIGAGVRGDARIINERRAAAKARKVRAVAYRGSGAVHDPEGFVEGTIGLEGEEARRNEDYFANHKAQSWWSLRKRFQKTWRWVAEGISCAPDEIISISPDDPDHMKLVAELSQATYRTNEAGKILVDKKPAGQKSPNRADAVVIAYAPMEEGPTEIDAGILAQIARAGRGGTTRAR